MTSPTEQLSRCLSAYSGEDGRHLYGSRSDVEPYRGQVLPSSTHQERLAAFDDVLKELGRAM
jgi:hypothetical protein